MPKAWLEIPKTPQAPKSCLEGPQVYEIWLGALEVYLEAPEAWLEALEAWLEAPQA